MRLYKRRGSKNWWFEFVFRGVRHQQSSGLANRREAQTYSGAYRLRLIEGELNVKRKQAAPAFSKAMEDFLKWSEEHHSDHPNTTLRYRTASKPLLNYFGNTPIDAIQPDDIERYRAQRSRRESERTSRKLKPATINRELACLKALFNHFIKLDIIIKNPSSRVKLKPENNEQMRVLSFEEEQVYLASTSQPLRDFAVIMLETGMRPEEVVRITKSNIHLDEGFIFNPHGKTKAARRKIPLTSRAADVLKARIDAAKDVYIFPHKDDPAKPMIKLNNAHTGALKRSGLDHFRIYDLRHTFATRFIESGGDLVSLAALLGHSKIQMVMRYAHPTAGHQIKAMKALEAYTTAGQMETFGAGDPATVN